MVELSRRHILKAGAAGLVTTMSANMALADENLTGEDALDLMAADPRFSDWVEVLEFAGLTQYAINSRFTAFVPTNAAFGKYPTLLVTLLSGRGRAFADSTVPVQFVRSHVVLDLHPLSEFSGRKAVLTAVSGGTITIDGTQTGVYSVTWQGFNARMASARISDTPMLASNAIIYAVDDVTLT